MSALAPSLNLGVIGNCAASALVDARGRIVWSCWPRFDGDPVFNALLQGGDTPAVQAGADHLHRGVHLLRHAHILGEPAAQPEKKTGEDLQAPKAVTGIFK